MHRIVRNVRPPYRQRFRWSRTRIQIEFVQSTMRRIARDRQKLRLLGERQRPSRRISMRYARNIAYGVLRDISCSNGFPKCLIIYLSDDLLHTFGRDRAQRSLNVKSRVLVKRLVRYVRLDVLLDIVAQIVAAVAKLRRTINSKSFVEPRE